VTIDLIYVEEEIADHPRAASILAKLPRAEVVACERHGEIFNRRGQNFRLQKRRPAMILARKRERFILPAPPGYGIGARLNFYFSHMLNCLFDCRYCFLQGMFRSAHYLLFVNYEDFQRAIDDAIEAAGGEPVHFFSGYDCDSLASEPLTGFVDAFLPFFADRPGALLELRTKSAAIDALLRREPSPNVVVAFSFTPEPIRRALESGVPSVGRRLDAMARLAERGWRLGLRFDPLIYTENFRELYRGLLDETFARVPVESLHSISLGPFRLPRGVFKEMARLMPEDRLLAGPLEDRDGLVSYRRDLEEEIVGECSRMILERAPASILFPLIHSP
jgi:spore photoproduct lyase